MFYLNVCLRATCMAGAKETRKQQHIPPGLKFQMIGHCQWVLGIEPVSSAGGATYSQSS